MYWDWGEAEAEGLLAEAEAWAEGVEGAEGWLDWGEAEAAGLLAETEAWAEGAEGWLDWGEAEAEGLLAETEAWAEGEGVEGWLDWGEAGECLDLKAKVVVMLILVCSLTIAFDVFQHVAHEIVTSVEALVALLTLEPVVCVCGLVMVVQSAIWLICPLALSTYIFSFLWFSEPPAPPRGASCFGTAVCQHIVFMGECPSALFTKVHGLEFKKDIVIL